MHRYDVCIKCGTVDAMSRLHAKKNHRHIMMSVVVFEYFKHNCSWPIYICIMYWTVRRTSVHAENTANVLVIRNTLELPEINAACWTLAGAKDLCSCVWKKNIFNFIYFRPTTSKCSLSLSALAFQVILDFFFIFSHFVHVFEFWLVRRLSLWLEISNKLTNLLFFPLFTVLFTCQHKKCCCNVCIEKKDVVRFLNI